MRTFVRDIIPAAGVSLPVTSSYAIAAICLDDCGLAPDSLAHGVTIIRSSEWWVTDCALAAECGVRLYPTSYRILRHHAGDLDDVRAAAIACRGKSPADIAQAVRDAMRVARKAKRDLVADDIRRVVKASRPKRSAHDDRLVAVHEAGHALVAADLGVAVHWVDLDAAHDALGNPPPIATRAEVEAYLKTLLAGPGADELWSGGANTGSAIDFSMATGIASALVSKWSLGDRLQVLDDAAVSMSRQVAGEVEAILAAAKDEALAILRSRSLEHSALVEALLRHRYLDTSEVGEILERKGYPNRSATKWRMTRKRSKGILYDTQTIHPGDPWCRHLGSRLASDCGFGSDLHRRWRNPPAIHRPRRRGGDRRRSARGSSCLGCDPDRQFLARDGGRVSRRPDRRLGAGLPSRQMRSTLRQQPTRSHQRPSRGRPRQTATRGRQA